MTDPKKEEVEELDPLATPAKDTDNVGDGPGGSGGGDGGGGDTGGD
jgi:uncharacterized membrane protein